MASDYEIAFRLQAQMNADFRRNFGAANQQIEELQRQLREIENSRGPNRAGEDANRTRGAFDRARGAAKGFMSILARVAQYTGAYAVVSGIVDGFQNAIGLVGEFEGGMAQLQASTTLTAKEMEGIKGQASSLYRDNIGENWDDLTRSLATVKQVTDLSGDALKSTTRNAVVFRDVFGEDVTQSIRAADQMTRQFGITQDEAYNLMAQGMKGGLNMSDELIDSISEYSVYFKKLGYDADDMFNMFGSGAESGVFQLDKIGDSIKELTIRSKDQSKTTHEGYKLLNLNAAQFESAVAGGGENAKKATQKIFQALSKIQDPIKRNAAGVSLFGTQFEDLEYEAIKAMGEARSQFDKTRKTMDNVKNVKFNTLGMAFQAIGRSVEMDFIQPLGKKLLPLLSDVAKWFTSKQGKKFFANIQNDIQYVIKKAKEFYNVIKDNWGKIADVLVPVVAGIAAAKIAFDTLKVIGVINTLMTAFRAGTVAATLAQWGLNAAFLANPMTWVVVGIGALVAAIVIAIRHWGAIKTAVLDFWTSVKGWLGGMGAWFSERWNEAYNSATTAFSGLTGWFGGIFESIKGTFNDAVNWIIGRLNWVIDKANGISFDIPDFMGGGKIGVDIPKIPTVGGYATGGYVNKPELAWVGEGKSPEWIIPDNNSPKSRGLLDAANRSMGYAPAPSGGGMNINYSPNIIIQGNASQRDIEAAQATGQQSFEQQMAQWQRQKERVSFG
jgi:phage-related minor tail protein